MVTFTIRTVSDPRNPRVDHKAIQDRPHPVAPHMWLITTWAANGSREKFRHGTLM